MADVLRVAQLNAGSLLEPGWPERRLEIAAWLERLEPDVVCLQEIWEDERTPNTAAWFVDHLPDAGWHHAFGGQPVAAALWPDQSLRFGSAVLSRWPIDDVTYHALPVADDPDNTIVRSVPWELLHVRTAGLDVFSCHLAAAPTDGRHRRRQVLAIDEIIRAAAPPSGRVAPGQRTEGMPPILCGDFNAEPESDEIRFLSSLTVLDGRTTYYQDAWRVAGDGPGFTQDWRINPIAAGLNVPRKRIDYVFVGDAYQRRDDAGRVLRAEPAFHEPLTGTVASDHAGLVVDIVWPQRPEGPP